MTGGFPENGRFDYGPRDPQTGIAWCRVTRDMAHAHPKGRLGVIEYAIAGYFLLSAVIRLWLILSAGVGSAGGIAVMVIQVLTGLGLLFRVPLAIGLAVLQLCVTVIFLVTAFRGAQDGVLLAEAVVAIFIVAYLFEGERPNLIYRHRFRSYRDTGEDRPE